MRREEGGFEDDTFFLPDTDGTIKLVTWRLGRKVSLIGERILSESGRDYFLFGIKKTDNLNLSSLGCLNLVMGAGFASLFLF